MSPEQALEQMATPATYGASGFTFIAGLTIGEWVAIGGLILGLLTFATNFYFRCKLHKRQVVEHKAAMDTVEKVDEKLD